jgi:hypothetical protein
MRFALALALLVGLPAAAQAQTHPCDVTPAVPDVRPGVGFAVGFCVDGKDAEGNPVTYDSFKVAIDGTQVFNAGLTPVGAPSATGMVYYETPKTLKVATAGTHSVVVRAASLAGGDSLPSAPLSFAAKALPPNSPLNQRIVK